MHPILPWLAPFLFCYVMWADIRSSNKFARIKTQRYVQRKKLIMAQYHMKIDKTVGSLNIECLQFE